MREMLHLSRRWLRIAVVKFALSVIFGVTCLLPCAAGEEPLQGLASKSPFGTKAQPAAVAEPPAGLEFRGVFVDKGEPFFSLFDPVAKSSGWVGLNEPEHPFVVREFDAAKNQVVVEYRGKKLSLGLKQAKVTAMAVVAPSVAPAPSSPPEAASAPVPTAVPVPDEAERKRQAEIAEEVRRRRELRQDAAREKTSINAPPAQPPPLGNSH